MDIDLLLVDADGSPAPVSEYADEVKVGGIADPKAHDNGQADAFHSANGAHQRLSDSPAYVPYFAGVAGAPAVDVEETFDDSLGPRDRASSVASSAATPAPNLKASTNSRKRKLADSVGRSASSTPAPPDDSAYVAVPPLLVPSPCPNFFATRNHPINKSGYRYTACGPSPKSRPLFPIYRGLPAPPIDTVRFSWEDRSPYVYISQDANAISTDKGFRAARGNVPMREGSWYFEVTIEKGVGEPAPGEKGGAYGPHVRLGIGRREASLNAPVGFDGYSYGIRDTSGEKVHLSVPKPYGSSGFGTGDVVGVFVHLPERTGDLRSVNPRDPMYNANSPNPAHIVRKRVAIRYKGQLYFESTEYAASKEMEDLAFKTADPVGFAKAALEAQQKLTAKPPPGRKKAPTAPPPPPPRPLPILPGSEVRFYRNGEDLGPAFTDLYDWLPLKQHAKRGTTPSSKSAAAASARENRHDDGSIGYFPMVSVFGGGAASINPGPEFRYPPSLPEHAWRPLIDRYAEYWAEQAILDDIEDELALAKYEANADQYLMAVPAPNTGGGGGKTSKGGKQHQTKKKTGLSKQLELATPDSMSSSTSPGPIMPIERQTSTDEVKVQVSPAQTYGLPDQSLLGNNGMPEMHAEGLVKMEVD